MSINILAFDPDIALADWLKAILDEGCYRLEIVHFTADVVKAVRKYDPDIIILSLMSPRLEEIKLCKRIRRFSNVPILVLSALNTPSIVAQLLDEGANNFLCRPVKNDVLIAHIRTLMRRMRFEYKNQFMRKCCTVDERIEFCSP